MVNILICKRCLLLNKIALFYKNCKEKYLNTIGWTSDKEKLYKNVDQN